MVLSDKTFKYSSYYTSALFLVLLGITILNQNSRKINISCDESHQSTILASQGNDVHDHMNRFCASNTFIIQQNSDYTDNTYNNNNTGSSQLKLYQSYYGHEHNYFMVLILLFAIPYWSWMRVIVSHADWPKDFLQEHNFEQLAIKYILKRQQGYFNDMLPLQFIGRKVASFLIQLLAMVFLIKFIGHASIFSYGFDVIKYAFSTTSQEASPMDFLFPTHNLLCDYKYLNGTTGELEMEHVLCKLPNNYVNSWIFLFAWVWITMTAIPNALSIPILILMRNSGMRRNMMQIDAWKLKGNSKKDYGYGEYFMLQLLRRNLETPMFNQFLLNYGIQRQLYDEEV